MKNVILLGATGSIGSQVIDYILQNDEYSLYAIAFYKNIEKAKEIITNFKPKIVSCGSPQIKKILETEFPSLKVVFGESALQTLAALPVENPIVVNALVGSVGLLPTIAAISAKRNVYLANKETLVIGGEIVMDLCKKNDVKIIPIDSEHSAIFQLIHEKKHTEINKLYLTASGGPFLGLSKNELLNKTKDDALNHPTWKMGPKISIDSATLMNKGFEVIEAKYLFDINVDNIICLIHKESIIHSMVEFKDYSIFAQLGLPDMHLPIKYAFDYPSHSSMEILKPLSFDEGITLSLKKVNDEYKMINLAKEALKKGGIYPAVLNAANEAAVELFLKDKIKFLDIEEIVQVELNSEIYKKFNENNLDVTLIMFIDEMVKRTILNRY